MPLEHDPCAVSANFTLLTKGAPIGECGAWD